MRKKSYKNIAASWINYQVRFDEKWNLDHKGLGYDDPDWFALEQLWDCIATEPGKALEILDEIVANTNNEAVLGIVGASPLEDLLHSDVGFKYAPLVIERAKRDKNWRLAFGHVWTHGFKDRGTAALIEASIDELYPNARL
jgi:hypothetical protein